MELTPIKIPGKNKRDKSKSAIAARKALVSRLATSIKFLANGVLTTYRSENRVGLSN